MPWLKYYDREHELFPTEYETKLTDNEARYAFKRLKAHYHFTHDFLIRGRGGSGRCDAWTVRVSHEPSVGLLAHEIAHAIDKRRHGKKAHTKRHTGIMRRVCEYIMRHLPQWREFLKHRHAECTARTQARLTRLEEIVRYKNSVAGKLEHLKEMEKRWTRRQRLAETRLKNIRRKIKRLERRQQTGPEACPTGNACV